MFRRTRRKQIKVNFSNQKKSTRIKIVCFFAGSAGILRVKRERIFNREKTRNENCLVSLRVISCLTFLGNVLI